ncbi:OLC1v1010586C1 [Oldenlandia corymbosa var. corymbosa]|uniref:OLC1v1010586C1 n=1 Tax=Oldenlandia corymbosa var. corymbosa TaxID=529605 RepID=A0AAV1DUW5_OLDCO|nr:OLC1v1010586C1 [Oldenlandia corymbosa var. corymbosa]
MCPQDSNPGLCTMMCNPKYKPPSHQAQSRFGLDFGNFWGVTLLFYTPCAGELTLPICSLHQIQLQENFARVLDERIAYDDLDEYEEDGLDDGVEGGGEDEYEDEEEEPKPTKEVLDYLELRQKLKEQKKKELRKENGTVNGSLREKKNLISRDSFGSFFGPSQPVIAQRVIQESKSLLETASSTTRINKSSQSGNKSSGSSLSRNPQSSGQKPRVPNLQHKKVEILKNARDYSFLLSDDAEVPVPKTVPPPRNISAPKPELRSAPQPERSKGSVSGSGRKDFSSREDKRSSTAVDRNRMQPRLGTDRLSSGGSQVRALMDSRKHIGTTNGAALDRKKQLSSSNGSGPGRPVLSKNAPSSNINGSGPGRPVMTKTVPPKASVGASERKGNVPVPRSSAPIVQRPASSKQHPSVSRQSLSRKDEYLRERAKGRDEHQVRAKPKVISKQSVPASKPRQVIRPPPKNVARETSRDEHPRKRPLRHDDDDDDDPENALSMIRSMFGYNPRKYHDDDSDDSNMEANFDDILKEEKRSERIARLEDEEEQRKIEEEERRERMRKEAKRRKLSNR